MNWLQDRFDDLQDRVSQVRFGSTPDEGDEQENQTLLQQLNESTTLNKTQRLLGFAVCFGMGMLLSLIAPSFILRPVKLATILTLGNLLSLGSMMFLMGPMKQCQSMMDEKRRIATLVYIGSLIMTIVTAFVVKSMLLCLVCIAIQYTALFWYSLSYIPYGQSMLLRVLPFKLPTTFSAPGADDGV